MIEEELMVNKGIDIDEVVMSIIAEDISRITVSISDHLPTTSMLKRRIWYLDSLHEKDFQGISKK
jgi:hypothetical protein